MAHVACAGNQCCAVAPNNTRCRNIATSSLTHCELHRKKSVQLYLKYKELSDIAESLNVNKPIKDINVQIGHVLKCYNAFDKAYYARMLHRRYAFVPECYDVGHDKQFTILMDKLNECEKILSELYEKVNHISKLSELSESSEEQITIVNLPKKINKRNNNRKKVETENDDWINKYIEENKLILSQKAELVNNIEFFISKLFDPQDEEEAFDFLFEKCVMVDKLTRRLYALGYLPKDYNGGPVHDSKGKIVPDLNPSFLEKCHCGNYKGFDLKLMCGCIYEYNMIFSYFNLSSYDSLSMFYGTMIHNKDKIQAVVHDLISLCGVYRHEVMYKKLYLMWDSIQSRLRIVENPCQTRVKYSKIMARDRLKDKYQRQQLNKITT